ncbi:MULTISPECIES: phosphate acyltransferase [Vagococcus]|uniref:Phosphotransbutyrylase n=1 Tax=Vagococcus fluvialis bH819 TaxID=1255619 RepID=A0A1X6WQM3_9ENTE|nr:MULTISPECIES: phosphate acyltransferase [Vagococcus]SLM86579.1 phosphotransbutyrylase [Vagococcus fluvialis bH819]HCM90787.1 phosphotransacetylase [Vagococcus sp.]
MITISVAGGSQPEILKLVKKAREECLEDIRFVVFDTNQNIADDTIWEYIHCDDEKDIAKKAVEFVANKKAEILLKGIIQTHTLLKELLNKEHALKNRQVLSHVAMVDIKSTNQSFLLTDCAMNIAPDKDNLIEIVENVKEVAHKIGISQPKIALLSAAENVNPKMPSSVLATEVTEHFKETQDSIIFGPISLDLALSKEAVDHKRYQGPIMGDADVIVVPAIDAGNSLYKSLTLFGGAKVGGTIVGTKVPVVLTSRSDSTDSKLHSLKFAIKQV